MLHLYDSKSARIQPLSPVTPGKVGIYLCGATVQGSPHVGHLRAAVSFDTLIRWLRRSGYQVTYVRNVTDIDDKILNKSAEAGWDWWAWAYRFEREFTQAYETLGVQAPTYEPRATGHIPDQIDLVQRLIDAGHAYSDGRGNVYFDVHSQADYGSLTRQRLADMRTTEDDAQIDEAVEAGKRDPRDSPSGRPVSRLNRPRPRGTAPGDADDPAGTSNAPPCRAATSATNSTSTAAASTCASRTTRTSKPNPTALAGPSHACGSTTRG